MNIVTEIINNTRRKLIVSIPREKIEDEEKNLLKIFIKDNRIPGFRPGKAPVDLIKKHYQKPLQEELKRKLISQAYSTVIKDSDFDVYGLVEIQDKTLMEVEDEPKVTFIVNIVPAFELPDYKAITLNHFDMEVKEEEISNILDMLRKQYADFKEKEGPAMEGDYVQVSYEGKVGEQPIAELAPDKPLWGKQEYAWEEAGTFKEDVPTDQQFRVKAIVKGLVDMKAGDEKTVEQLFPEDFFIKELAGKTGTYSINVHGVRERTLPEWNEDLFKKLKVESLEKLREEIINNLKANKERQKKHQYQNEVIEALKKECDFPIPENAVENEAQYLRVETTQKNLQRGVPKEEIEKHSEEIINDSQKGASGNIRLRYILSHIAKKENIKASEEDLTKYIKTQSAMKKTSPEKMGKELAKDKEQLNRVCESIVLNKTLDFIVSQAKVIPNENIPEKVDSSSKKDVSNGES